MIYSIMHVGSGIGNQLARYIALRCLAMEKGYDFSVIAPENFKGSSFLNLDMGKPNRFTYQTQMPTGKVVVNEPHKLWVENSVHFNPELFFVEDETVIDGEFQSEQYFGHRLDKINEWLNVEPMGIPNNVCIINFRGGEYALYDHLFLQKDYWNKAISMMGQKYPGITFEVHTDDAELAKMYFPEYLIYSDIEVNWRSIRYAKHLILSNSSFAILPALLGDAKEIIAPRGWARHNLHNGEWSMPQNFYRRFLYI